MRRACAWVAVAAAAALLVPATAGSARTTVLTAAPAALPVPTVAQPRLGFVDRTDELLSVRLEVPDPESPPDPPVPVWDPSADATVSDLRTGHAHDGEASVTSPLDELQVVATVSTADADDPTDPGDVYVNALEPEDPSDPTYLRVTCGPAQETHPVVSPDGTQVAFATDARGDWDIAVAPVPAEGQACDPEAFIYVTGPEGQDTWPTWLDDVRLVYASTRDSGLPDLYAVDDAGIPLAQLTDTPDVAETQPSASASEGAWDVLHTTTQFRPDGSLAVLHVTDATGLPRVLVDPYELVPFTRPQASEGTWSGAGHVAFTTTASDPAGDIWVSAWQVADDGSVVVTGSGPIVQTFWRQESHPAWASDIAGTDTSGAEAVLYFTREVVSTDVSDVVADDGSALRQIGHLGPTGGEGLEFEAGIDYSPDGTRVVRSTPESDDVAGQRLVLDDAGTLDPVPFPYERDEDDIDLDPTWSPDGRTIAFVRWAWNGDGWNDARVHVVDVGSGEVTSVASATDDPSDWSIDPSWAPDSTRLVYAGGFGSPDVNDSYLRIADLAAGTSQALTITVPEECEGGGSCDVVLDVFGRSPDWSPEGSRIAVADLRVQQQFDDIGILAAPADAAAAFPPGPTVEPDDLVGYADPGGIAVLDLESATGTPEIASAHALTGSADGVPLTTSGDVQAANDPEWSPDGTRLAFSGVAVGQPAALRAIWEVSGDDGTDLRRVVELPGLQREPAYQPWSDLVLALTASAVADDGTATVTAVATNAGPGLVTSATVTLALPDGVTSPGAPGCSVTGQEVTCELTGPVAAGAAAQVDVPVAGVTGTADPTVTGVVATPTPERVVTNNTATVDLGFAGGVNVTVTLSSAVAWVGGLPVTATITVRNGGEQPTADVTLTTTYPGVVTPSGLAPCAPTGACALGTLPGGGSVVLTATLTPDVVFEGPPQTGAVTAVVSTTSPDPNPADDTASAQLEVRRPHVVLSPSLARPGEVVFLAGTDFPPTQSVILTWSVGVMSVPLPVTVDGDGRWQRSLLVLRDGIVTSRDLLARSVEATPTFGEMSAPLLVVPSSVDAPTFLFRN